MSKRKNYYAKKEKKKRKMELNKTRKVLNLKDWKFNS